MKYKHCPAPFCNRFIQPSPLGIAKLKFLHCVLRRQVLPLKWLHKIPNPEAKCAKVVFQIKSPICGVNFSNNISIALVKVNERKN